MRTKIQDKRLLKLIKFLEVLPPEKFDLGLEVSKVVEKDDKLCPTVACAIGWTPVLFPKLVKWGWHLGMFYKFILEGEDCGFQMVAEKLFGVPNDYDVFWPGGTRFDKKLPSTNRYSTPKQVAKMLRVYRKLYK